MQDQVQIESALRGDRAALETLIVQHQSAIYGYLRARLLQHSDAEDLTQEVFLRFYLARARFDSKQLIRPWLLGIARNLLREHARKTRRLRQTAWTELCLELEELLKIEARDDEDDIFIWLPQCLAGLGESARQAIDLHYSANLRLAEIGEQLKRSEGAVKLLVFRARQALKRCLDQKMKTGGKTS
jgi:RNA polymerase sigma-70 factor (ECF subfamily)